MNQKYYDCVEIFCIFYPNPLSLITTQESPLSSIMVYSKNLNANLTEHFTLKEFKCKCRFRDCTRTLVLPSTLLDLQSLRFAYGKPIKITSGFRCQRHNERVGGIKDSFHRIGCAVDIKPIGDFSLYELDMLEELARSYFDVVLRYDSFIHCHNEPGVQKLPFGHYQHQEKTKNEKK